MLAQLILGDTVFLLTTTSYIPLTNCCHLFGLGSGSIATLSPRGRDDYSSLGLFSGP